MTKKLNEGGKDAMECVPPEERTHGGPRSVVAGDAVPLNALLSHPQPTAVIPSHDWESSGSLSIMRKRTIAFARMTKKLNEGGKDAMECVPPEERTHGGPRSVVASDAVPLNTLFSHPQPTTVIPSHDWESSGSLYIMRKRTIAFARMTKKLNEGGKDAMECVPPEERTHGGPRSVVAGDVVQRPAHSYPA